MTLTLENYLSRREKLLAEIIDAFSVDERFVAAWLTGSYSRDQQDALSDIDICIVVADSQSETLCHRAAQVSAQTSPERTALFCQFGEIASLHENNHNAPEGGTFTNTIFAETALVVDWILVPLRYAQRPMPSRLLFDRVGIPLASVPILETREQRTEKISEIVAFFWMMNAITIKYLVRGDGVFAMQWLEELHKMMREIKRLLVGDSPDYHSGSLTMVITDCADQVEALYQLALEMESLLPEIEALGAFVRLSPLPTFEVLFNFAREKCNG